MSELENGLDLLTKQVVDKRVGGFTFEEIAETMQIPTAEVVKTWRDYVDNRAEMSQEEQWVLHLLRLENLLTKAHARLNAASEAEDFELILKLLDRVEALQGLNVSRKKEAESALEELTKQQMAIVMRVMLQMQQEFKRTLESAFEHKTIKAIKGELIGNYDELFMTNAKLALTTVGEEM